MKKDYIPVSCEFVDYIEIFAMRGKRVNIAYLSGEESKEVSARIKTWFTREKVEYLETTEGLVLRLDKVLSIDGVFNGSSCSL